MSYRRSVAWGILGTGNIARQIAGAIRETSSGEIVAVGSRSLDSAKEFAGEFEIGRAFGSYEEVLTCAEVEAVYISLPNHLHAEWTMRCAAAGKHILCEKPFTVNRVEAERVIGAVRTSRVFLMEAFMYRCHSQTAKLVQIIRNGDIGEIRLIQAGYSFKKGPEMRMTNAKAEGSIMGVGCYPMSMARLIAGAAHGNPFQNPTEIRGAAYIDSSSGVDELATASVKFPGSCVAAISCGTTVHADVSLRIWGSEGHIIVPQPWTPPQTNARILVQRNGEDTPAEILVDAPASLYGNEVDFVANSIRSGDLEASSPCMSWSDTLGNMIALDAWRADVGLSFDCER